MYFRDDHIKSDVRNDADRVSLLCAGRRTGIDYLVLAFILEIPVKDITAFLETNATWMEKWRTWVAITEESDKINRDFVYDMLGWSDERIEKAFQYAYKHLLLLKTPDDARKYWQSHNQARWN